MPAISSPGSYVLTIEAELLPQLATALRLLHREQSAKGRRIDDRMAWLETQVNTQAVKVLTNGPGDMVITSEAASMLGVSTSYVRKIADRLDGVRSHGHWLYPRDSVLHYRNRNRY